MTMIDQLNPNPASAPVRPVAMRYGLIWGAFSAALMLIGNLLGMDPGMPDTSGGTKAVFLIIGFGVAIWAVVMAIKQHRDTDLGGYISLGRGIGVGTLTGLFAGLLYMVWILLFLYLIAPDYLSTLTEATRANLEEKGLDEEQIEMSMKFTSYVMNPIGMAVSSIFNSVFFGFLIGLIGGAIMKRERPGV